MTNFRSVKSPRVGRLIRLVTLGAALAALGCGDGVERNSVSVPDRNSMKPGGSDEKPAAGRKQAPDTKVMTPGGKKM